MLNSSIFDSVFTSTTLTGQDFLLATLCSVVCGLVIALLYKIKNKPSRSFLVTLVVLPAAVQMVIMLVNGNLGAGVAVAGAFSLVRFRSVPGKGQEIAAIFEAMAVGLATGMGYLGIAGVFTIVISVLMLVLDISGFGGRSDGERMLKIMVPENLDFEGKFDSTFDKYLSSYRIEEVKTTNMGSLYKISYLVTVKPGVSLKEMIDELRTGNGNLEISVSRPVTVADNL
ncbi:MAG: DUF4956 domain-containing protein [Eubacterium sp.]|nr:DUF4956 domain-containing protein [Eubacterium sp.]